MLGKHAERVVTYFAVHYPEVQLGGRLGEAAGRLLRELKAQQIHAKVPASYVIPLPEEGYQYVLTWDRIVWQSLGLSSWQADRGNHLMGIETALAVMGLDQCKRTGFKVSAHLPIEMTHAEACSLMFGAFLCPQEDFEDALQPTTTAIWRTRYSI